MHVTNEIVRDRKPWAREEYSSPAVLWFFALLINSLLLIAFVSSSAQAQTASLPALEIQGNHAEKVKLVVMGLPAPAAADVGSVTSRKVLKAFLDEYPNYNMGPFLMPSISADTSQDTTVLMAIAAGIPPNVIFVNFRQSSTFVAQGFLEPTEILLARLQSKNEKVRRSPDEKNWAADPSPEEIASALQMIRQRVPKAAWQVVYRHAETDDNPSPHAWAVPTNTLVIAMLYRRDLYQQAGLDPDHPPRNWDELLDFSRKLTIPSINQFAMAVPRDGNISWSIYTYLVSNGARAVEQDANGHWHAAFNRAGAAEAIDFFWRLSSEPFERDGEKIPGVVRFTNDGWNLWNRGQIAMMFSYLDERLLSSVNPQLVGIAPAPLAPSGHRASELNCQMMGVFAASTPNQKLAAMRYIWFITSEKADQIRTRSFVEAGYGQFVNPVLLKRHGYDYLLKQIPPGWQDAFTTSLENGVPEPYGKNTQNIYRYMSPAIHQSLENLKPEMDRQTRIQLVQGYLDKAANEINIKVLANVPPEKMRVRRIVASSVIVAIVIAFAIGFYHIFSHFSRVAAPIEGKRHWRKYVWGYILLLPGLGLVLLWSYFPLLIGGLSMAFMDYQLVRESRWVGVDNFANVLFDDKFWWAMWRTFYYVALSIGLGFWPPILLAMLLQEIPTTTAKYLFRTIFYLPAIISGIVVMFLWKQLYDSSQLGILNQLLLGLNNVNPVVATIIKLALIVFVLTLIVGLFRLPMWIDEMGNALRWGMWITGVMLIFALLFPLFSSFSESGFTGVWQTLASLIGGFNVKPLRWTESPQLAMLCVIIPHIWSGSGPGCILYLAALKNIPEELYEAADIDGATHWHKVFYIVVPTLKYLLGIQFVAAMIGAFRGGSDVILALTGGGPGDATMIVALEIFMRTFLDLNFGSGTAMAWILGALLIGFTAFQLKNLSNAEFKAAR